jgi:Zn finger protein HypA/HybF involved in hydrogenase expression
MVECLNCDQSFDPTRYRWRCPACGMKDTCCEGEPCPVQTPAPAVPPSP